MFMGEYAHTVDEKGRIIMPAKFRDQLDGKFYVTKGLDKCLFVYSKEEWSGIEAKFREIPLTTKDARAFARKFFSGACECEIDKQGRMLLPQNLREHAGLIKDVVLAGVLNRIEIWSKESWEDADAATDMDDIAETMASLGLML